MLTPKQEMFAQLVARGVSGSEAMAKAGYSQNTIRRDGPAALLRKEKIRQRIQELQDVQLGGVIDAMKVELMRLQTMLGKALTTLEDLMENGSTETARYKAAAEILNASKGIIVASIPKKHAHFHVAMRDLYEQAKGITDADSD